MSDGAGASVPCKDEKTSAECAGAVEAGQITQRKPHFRHIAKLKQALGHHHSGGPQPGEYQQPLIPRACRGFSRWPVRAKGQRWNSFHPYVTHIQSR